MQTLVENPLPILAMGGISVAILISGLLKTGRTSLVYAIALVILLTVGLVFVERAVVTTREEIAATLQQIAADLESGNATVITSHIANDADQLRRRAERILPDAVFHQVKIKRNVEISAREQAGLAEALTASFNAVVVVSERDGFGDRHHVPSFFVVEFVRQDGCWKVRDYDRRDPREGIR